MPAPNNNELAHTCRRQSKGTAADRSSRHHGYCFDTSQQTSKNATVVRFEPRYIVRCRKPIGRLTLLFVAPLHCNRQAFRAIPVLVFPVCHITVPFTLQSSCGLHQGTHHAPTLPSAAGLAYRPLVLYNREDGTMGYHLAVER